MNKTKHLMGITVYDLNNKTLTEKLIKSINKESYYVSYDNTGYDISTNHLIDIAGLKEDYVEDLTTEDWDCVLADPDNYFLFTIDWSDELMSDWINESGIDIFLETHVLSSIKKGVDKLKTVDAIIYFNNKNINLLYKDHPIWLVLCFEYSASVSYEGEWDSDLSYVGVVDMNKLVMVE